MLLSEKQMRKYGFAHYHQCGAEVFEFPTGRGKPRYVVRLIHSTAIAVGTKVMTEGSFCDAYDFAKARGNEAAVEALQDIAMMYLDEED
jgi:hypothetical protein